jgi:crossover junction endodeoxyribonuclease RuvC
MDELRILGVDPGLNITGYAVVAVGGPDQIHVVEAGILRGGDAQRDIGQRLLALRRGLVDVISTLRPATMAMESLYSHYDRPQTAILMGHARGVLCLTAAERDLPVHHYASTQVKRMLTGNGRASKTQIQRAVTHLLHLDDVPDPPDVADALAIAVCHYYLNERKTASPSRQAGRPSSSTT